jgi:23S rRNA pseudouridine955/2504/2580 synthase/23S rRNA pseudouridine1911/1915/1917 synthase
MKKERMYEIIHQDQWLVAVNKAARLAVLPGRGRKESLIDFLAGDKALGGKKPLLVHRIDADTSGLIVLALTPEAQKSMAEQFRTRTVTKEYWALVRGTPLHESGSVDLPIGNDPNNKNRMVIRGLEPKKSRTKWVVTERFGKTAGGGAGAVTLLKVFPVTGRRHQIRVHLKAMGYPLAVDPYYGGEKLLLSEFKRKYKLGKFQEERPLMERLTLHARALTFVHPGTGAETRWEAELPKDFRTAIAMLEKWAR